MRRQTEYREFLVYYDPKPGAFPDGTTIDWSYVHKDYDPTPNEPDGGPSDNRAGACHSFINCLQEIDNWWEENSDEPPLALIAVSYNHHRYRAPGLAQRYDDQWHASIHASYSLRDQLGSSVGALSGTAYGRSPKEAMAAAIEILDRRIEETIQFSLSRKPTPQNPPKAAEKKPESKEAEVEELSKLLGLE